MKNLSLELETELKAFATSLKAVWIEAEDIFKEYFSTDATTLVSALATDGTAATVSTKLTKAVLISGITFVTDLKDFFTNAAVSQTDYLATIQTILYGSASLGSPLSPAVESVGTRLYNLCATCLTLNNKAKALLDIYIDSELSAAVGAISSTTVVFGATSTKSLYTSGITLVEQYKKMLNNESVTTGDYAATLAKWEQV
jgi:hypothetical protein